LKPGTHRKPLWLAGAFWIALSILTTAIFWPEIWESGAGGGDGSTIIFIDQPSSAVGSYCGDHPVIWVSNWESENESERP